MIRNLKVLGLALVAILALSAMVASAASAQTDKFTSSAETTTITGVDEGKVELKVTGVGITCEEVSYHAHVESKEVTSITADPTYKKCFGPAGEAEVTGFGDWGEPANEQCDFVLHATGKADLVCPPGVEVTVESLTCNVHIPGQKGLGTIKYITDVKAGTSKHALTLELNIVKITANHTDGFFCPLTGSGHSETATLTGPITVWGEDAVGNIVDITHDA